MHTPKESPTRSLTGSAAAIAAMVAISFAAAAAEPSVTTSLKEEISAGYEEVFVFRTTRSTRTSGRTPRCESADFESTAEDTYQTWSIKTNSRDSRISKGHVREVGSFQACFGAIARGKPFEMYAVGTVAGIPWRGRGSCVAMDAQPPERAVAAFNCNLAISDLPVGYSGGWLTSSTVAPVLGSSAPPDAHVRGYMSTSIVTLRLWKSR